MDEYLRLETLFFCSSNCNFLKFSAQNLSLLPIFLTILMMYLPLSILPTFAITILQKPLSGYQIECPVFGISFFPRKFNVLFKFNYSKYNPRGLIFRGRGLYMEGVFRFKSWFLNAPGLIYCGAYYRNFTVCR